MNYLLYLNLAGQFLNLRIISGKLNTLTVGVSYLGSNHVRSNFDTGKGSFCVIIKIKATSFNFA